MTQPPNQELITAEALVARGDHHRLLAEQISVYLLLPVAKVEVNGAFFLLTLKDANNTNGQPGTILVPAATQLFVIEE